MKFIQIPLIAALLGLIIYNCSGEKEATVKKEKTVVVDPVLTKEDMYIPDSIKSAMTKANNLQKSESRKLFLQGLDLLANKGNPKASIEFFTESILYYPDEKNFMHLFKAYIETSDTTNAEQVNTIIEGLLETWGVQYYEIEFNKALVCAVKKDTNGCINSLTNAYMEGFFFKERVLNEKLFEFMEHHLPYQSFIASNFGSDDKLTRRLFKAFVKYYPDLILPYTVSNDSARNFNYDRYIDYNFSTLIPGMNDGRFSRDVSNEYMYVGKIKLEAGYVFVYKSFMAIADTLNPVKTYIVSYDTTGTLIADEMIGCFCSPTESKGFTINSDLTISTTVYKTSWEFDPLEKGYAGNKIIGTEEESKEVLGLEKNGAVKREGVAKTTETVTKTGG